MGRLAIKKDIRQVEEVAGKAGADTIRLWDGYRDQALLWRAIAILQLPITALAVIMAMITIYTSNPIVNVVPLPLPGRYDIAHLPDPLFINKATELVNLIASFQPQIARSQFDLAEQMLWEPALTRFQQDMQQTELRAIEETSRSQLFFINEANVKIERFPEEKRLVVQLPGTLQKLIGNSPLPAEYVAYKITMSIIPRTPANEYGIVVTNIEARAIPLSELTD